MCSHAPSCPMFAQARLATFLQTTSPAQLLRRRKLADAHGLHTLRRRGRTGCLSGLRASSAAAAAPTAAQPPQDPAEHSEGPPKAPLRAWHQYWALGWPQKQEQDKKPRKLSKIVSKLWKIMNVNGYLLSAALFCMVSSIPTGHGRMCMWLWEVACHTSCVRAPSMGRKQRARPGLARGLSIHTGCCSVD